jgi:hypothetical protein
MEWADLVEKARVNEFKPQWEAMRNGLACVLPIKLLTMFTWKELEILATGNPILDIEKLKVNFTVMPYLSLLEKYDIFGIYCYKYCSENLLESIRIVFS